MENKIEDILDKEIDKLRRFSNKINPQKIYELPIEQSRKIAKESILPFTLKNEKSTSYVEHELFFGNEEAIKIRVYSADRKDYQTGIVFFHGGGYVLYDVDVYHSLCEFISEACNSKVIFVEYRKPPYYEIVNTYQDCKNTLDWVVLNKLFLGIDNIVLMGDSVGGNLVLKTFQESEKNIDLIVLCYPVLSWNFTNLSYQKYGEGYFLDQKLMEWFKRISFGHLNDDELKKYNFTFFNEEIPNLILISSEFDVLRDESFIFQMQLQSQNSKSVHLHFENMGHNFLLMAGRFNSAKDALIKICNQLNIHINQLNHERKIKNQN